MWFCHIFIDSFGAKLCKFEENRFVGFDFDVWDEVGAEFVRYLIRVDEECRRGGCDNGIAEKYRVERDAIKEILLVSESLS